MSGILYSPYTYSNVSLKPSYVPPLRDAVNVSLIKTTEVTFGYGYLAGEFPGGTTTVDGAPVTAEVRALWRDPNGTNADGAVLAKTQSAPDGTWILTGLNPDLKYDVVGRKAGFNDVIVSNVTPTSMVDITYAGDITINETFTGALGHLELVGGIPPYAASVVDPLPTGMFPVVNGRQLIIDGTTTDDDVFNSTVRITSSNGAEKIIPLQLVVGFKAPANFKAETVVVDDVFSVSLTWEVTNSTQQVKVYRSATPFDLDDLPEPIATLSGASTTYTDDDVIEDDHFYYMVSAVNGWYELWSDAVFKSIAISDPHWDKVVSLLHFDGNSDDETGKIWQVRGAPDFNDVSGMFGTMCMAISPSTYQGLVSSKSADFNMDSGMTAELFVMFQSGDSIERSIFEFNGSLENSRDRLYVDKLPNYAIRVGYGGLSSLLYKDTTETYAPNVFHHIALTVTNTGYIELFMNGAKVLSFDSLGNLPVGNLVAAIGTLPSGAHAVNFRGKIDEYRVTKGVIRYTENFTPPTDPFQNK